MRFFQCVVAFGLLAVCSSQYLPGYFSRKQVTDSALYKFLSAVRGGGRGHRELLSITGSGSNPSSQALPPPQGLFRLPQGVNHIPPPPKIGAFYITAPETNAPFYYGGPRGVRRPQPQMFRITELKNGAPVQLVTAESSGRPGQYAPIQFIQLSGPPQQQLASASNVNAAPPQAPGTPGGAPIGVSGPSAPSAPSGPSGASGPSGPSGEAAGSLQEIIAQAVKKQHARVLDKEQKAHPNAQITKSQIILPGPGAGQQPIFINQFGQPFLAPAIYGPGPAQQGQRQQLPPQYLQAGPQGIAVLTQGPPSQGQQQNIGQLIKAQNLQSQQRLPFQFLPQGIQLISQEQAQNILRNQANQNQVRNSQEPRRPIPLEAHSIPGGGQILSLPQGAPQILPGQIAILPQGASIKQVQGLQGSLIPGNAILGQPHFALVGGGPLPGNIRNVLAEQKQQQQQHQQKKRKQHPSKADKEEQPKRSQEAPTQVILSAPSGPSAPSNNKKSGENQMTAAIMQSQMEFSEPINKS